MSLIGYVKFLVLYAYWFHSMNVCAIRISYDLPTPIGHKRMVVHGMYVCMGAHDQCGDCMKWSLLTVGMQS